MRPEHHRARQRILFGEPHPVDVTTGGPEATDPPPCTSRSNFVLIVLPVCSCFCLRHEITTALPLCLCHATETRHIARRHPQRPPAQAIPARPVRSHRPRPESRSSGLSPSDEGHATPQKKLQRVCGRPYSGRHPPTALLQWTGAVATAPFPSVVSSFGADFLIEITAVADWLVPNGAPATVPCAGPGCSSADRARASLTNSARGWQRR